MSPRVLRKIPRLAVNCPARSVRRRPALDALDERIVPSALWVSDAAVVEGSSGARYAEVQVRLDSPRSKPVSVDFRTVNGSALAGSDYTAVAGTLTFARGETTKSIRVPVLDDRLGELDESFSVKLSGARGATIGDREGIVTIVDNEPRITIGGFTGYRADAGSTAFTFAVSLSAPYDQAVTVNYATVDGTALAGVDYLATLGTLTFAPGETTKTITVEVLQDSTAGAGNKSFLISLDGASPNALVIGRVAEGTILSPDYDNTDTTNYWGSY